MATVLETTFSSLFGGDRAKLAEQNLEAQKQLAMAELAYKQTPEYRKQQTIYAVMAFVAFCGLGYLLYLTFDKK